MGLGVSKRKEKVMVAYCKELMVSNDMMLMLFKGASCVEIDVGKLEMLLILLLSITIDYPLKSLDTRLVLISSANSCNRPYLQQSRDSGWTLKCTRIPATFGNPA